MPLRLESPLAQRLGAHPTAVMVVQGAPTALPSLRCEMSRPAPSDVLLTVRIHSRQGIPLAQASASVRSGDQGFETGPVQILAMDPYSHVSAKVRHAVERRVWSRRAFVTGSVTD
jgi:hypothetical protein